MSERDRGVLAAIPEAEMLAAAAGEFTNGAQRQAFVQQYMDRKVREVVKGGPLGQAEDERFNALMAGPSRQALNASDIATTEGSRELGRLLRGEDASRDVNFAEMKHQTDLLQQIAEGIKAATGIAVQF